MADKKSTSKSSKKKEEQLPKSEKLTTESKIKAVDKLKGLKESEIWVLNDDVVVDIPISGSFNKALEGLFFHLMHPLNASQIIHTMQHIKTNFENIEEDKITNNDRALWAILTLLSEIHFQAEAQGKLKKTNAKVGNAIHGLLHGVEGATEQIAMGMQVAKAKLEKEDKKTPEFPLKSTPNNLDNIESAKPNED